MIDNTATSRLTTLPTGFNQPSASSRSQSLEKAMMSVVPASQPKETARATESVSNDLNALRTLGDRFADVKEELAACKESLEVRETIYQSQVSSYKKIVADLEGREETNKKAMDSLRLELTRQQENMAALQAKTDELITERHRLRSINERLEKRANDAEERLAKLFEEVDSLLGNINE